MEREPIIEFNEFTFKYYSQAEPTLHNINLKIYPHEKILIVGPSGSGKSTLGHCLNGLIPFAYTGDISGSLKIKGLETQELDIFTLSKTVGTVLQDSDGQFVGLSVGEDIAFALENENVATSEMHQRVKEVAKIVDMDQQLLSSPFELSGGQKQRTSLAGVMVDDIDILLFDEPLANLDPATGKNAIEIIDTIHKNNQTTTIIIEHRLEDVLYKEVDRVIVVNDGRIVADMNPHQLVSSNILIENGIREPLYITAMKYAGIEVDESMQPGYIDTLKVDGFKDKLELWQKSVHQDAVTISDQSIIEIKDVDFAYYEEFKILEDINLNIKKGEMISIVGRNGAGKSTLSKVISGFVKESKGNLYYLGEDIADLSIKERAEKIGVVMQNPNEMISETMIFDEVATGLRHRNVDEELIQEKVEEILKVCGLYPFREWPISALSFGQKKRVTIAAILVLDPEVIILDEPTAGQDFKHYTEIMEFLVSLNKMGITIILITHDMHLMLEYTPRAIVLNDGKIIADDDSAVILTDAEIIEEANLKETSLFNFAQLVDIKDETQFVQDFIDYERGLRNHE